MALIGTLRSKAGIWLVVFVFVAISAFILGDIFSGNSNITRWGADKVGSIAGKEISKKENGVGITDYLDQVVKAMCYIHPERKLPSYSAM